MGKNCQLQFLAADATDPPFIGAVFDAVVCRNLLWTLPDPALALQRWQQVLKPGGKLVVSDGIWRAKGIKERIRQYFRLMVSVMQKGLTNSTSMQFFLT